MKRTIFRNGIGYFAVMACSAWLLGCGPGEPPTGSVAGKVTFGGKPLTSGVVTLINETTGVGASVELDSSGSYSIPPIRTGTYQAAIHSTPPPPGGRLVRLGIPEKYQDISTSGLTVTVEEGDNAKDFAF